MLVIVGSIIVLASVTAGYMWYGGKLLALNQPSEVLIIFGAALGALIIANPMPVIKNLISQITGVLKGGYVKKDYQDLLVMMFEVFNIARRDGLVGSAILLMIIAHELGKLTNKLVIEGHTDASSSDGDYANWELSAARANSARRLMDVSGLDREQVNEVRGFASRLPMIMDDPGDPRNRRISIVVLYQNSAAGYDHMEIGEELVSYD